MTDEERQKLDDIHNAFFKPPAGGGPALITRINNTVTAFEQASFLSRFITRFLMGSSGLIGAYLGVKDFIWPFINKGGS